MNDDSSWITWVIVIAVIWGGYSLYNSQSSSDTEYGSQSTNYSERNYDSDGYSWAEDNDVSSFDDCQDEFGTGYDEDECNRYVQENHSGYESFNGYECTEDCSGHEAGYEWAEENDIYDEGDCDGNSDSFIEGCLSYVEDNY
jgi:hypothetical protein